MILIDFEGIDGSGKTAISKMLEDKLKELNIPVYHTRSGGKLQSPLSSEIRKISRNPNRLTMSDHVEALLYLAREKQLLDEKILPHKDEDAFVITDRYFYSHLVLSSYGRNLDKNMMLRMIDDLSVGISPDIVFLADVDITTSRTRKKIQDIKSNDDEDDFGRKGLSGMELRNRVRDGFISLANENKDTWIAINNMEHTLEQSFSRVWKIITKKFSDKLKLSDTPQIIEGKTKHVGYVSYTPKKNIKEIHNSFYESINNLSPDLKGFYLRGIASKKSFEVRKEIEKEAPQMLIYSLKNLTDKISFDYFNKFKKEYPVSVIKAQSDYNITEESKKLRLEMFEDFQGEVLRTLRSNSEQWVEELRLKAVKSNPKDVLRSLAKVDTDIAWEIRKKHIKNKYANELLRSLIGFDNEFAWEIRDKFMETNPAYVIISITGLECEEAHEIREKFALKAPKLVGWSLKFTKDERSWNIRNKCLDAYPHVLKSIKHIDHKKADELRWSLFPKYPDLVIQSLGTVYNKFKFENNPWLLKADESAMKNLPFIKSIIEREDKRKRSNI